MFNEDEIEKIIDMYYENVDVVDIAKQMNVHQHFIREVLKENQIDRQYNTFSKELENSVIKMYLDGYIHKDITYTLLVSSTGINKIIDRAGIERQSYSHRNKKYSRNSKYFDVIDTPNKAYILGLLYADGNNFNKDGHKNIITISLQDTDKYILEKIKDEIEYEGPIRFAKTSKYKEIFHDQYILAINDAYMSSKLIELGLIPRKSLQIVFPRWLDETLYPHFIRGYFDGDGCIYHDIKHNKWRTDIVGTKDFCQFVSKILTSMGIKNNCRQRGAIYNENTWGVWTSGNKSTYAFCKWMYEDSELKLTRKYEKFLDLCDYYKKVA